MFISAGFVPDPEMAIHSTETDDGSAGVHRESATGLEANVAGALAYVLGIVSGAIFYFIEDEDEFVRFHAAQSIVVSGALITAWIAFSVVTAVLGFVFAGSGAVGLVWVLLGPILTLVWLALSLLSLALWVYLIVSAYRGDTFRVPYAADVADRLV